MVNKEEIDGLKSAEDVNGLIEALKNFNPEIRASSAEALGKLGDINAVDPLISAVKDKDSNVRRFAAESLGQLKDRRAVNPLITALRDFNKRVQRSALIALGSIGDPMAVEPVIQLLKDKDKYVRASAITALGDIGDPAALESLEGMTKDDDDIDDIPIGNIASENIVRIKSNRNYIIYLRETMKKLEKAKRMGEAAKIQHEISTWEGRVGTHQPSRIEVVPVPMSEVKEEEKKEIISDYVEKKTTEPEATDSFNNCPFCGKKFSLKKTPKFCPYCNEELA